MTPGLGPTKSIPRLAPGRRSASAAVRRRPVWPLLAMTALLILVLVRGFIVQTFVVPSVSMQPTIQPGDRLVVDRIADDDDLRRGDIVVFDGTNGFASAELSPHQQESLWVRTIAGAASVVGVGLGRHYVKRVIGLQGDRVVCCDGGGQVMVNGVGVDEGFLLPGVPPSDFPFDVTVPAERIWVMGDNRSVSADSRTHIDGPSGGMVAVDNIVGRVSARYWPLSRIGPLSTVRL
jgi:signal peptidase I